MLEVECATPLLSLGNLLLLRVFFEANAVVLNLGLLLLLRVFILKPMLLF